MAEVVAVYRSTHPDVLAAKAQWIEDKKGLSAKIDALRSELPGGPRVAYAFSQSRLAGFEVLAEDRVSPPPGWRIATDRKGDRLVPARRNKEQKERSDRFRDARIDDPDRVLAKVGMPDVLFTGSGLMSHGTHEIEGVIYVTWSEEPEPGQIDEVRWERVPRSVYYAAREAAEAVRA